VLGPAVLLVEAVEKQLSRANCFVGGFSPHVPGERNRPGFHFRMPFSQFRFLRLASTGIIFPFWFCRKCESAAIYPWQIVSGVLIDLVNSKECREGGISSLLLWSVESIYLRRRCFLLFEVDRSANRRRIAILRRVPRPGRSWIVGLPTS